MMYLNPHYINERQSDIRGIKDGWYSIDDAGNLRFGPFFSQHECRQDCSEPTTTSLPVGWQWRLN